MKPALQSTTTTSVGAAGAGAAALLSLLELASAIWPEVDWLNHPMLATGSTWLISVVFIPWLSRQIAKARGKQ